MDRHRLARLLLIVAAGGWFLAALPSVEAAPRGAFASLSDADQAVARALYEAQKTRGVRPLTLDEIAIRYRNGEEWSDVFRQMRARGLLDEKTLKQVVRRYGRRDYRAPTAGGPDAGAPPASQPPAPVASPRQDPEPTPVSSPPGPPVARLEGVAPAGPVSSAPANVLATAPVPSPPASVTPPAPEPSPPPSVPLPGPVSSPPEAAPAPPTSASSATVTAASGPAPVPPAPAPPTSPPTAPAGRYYPPPESRGGWRSPVSPGTPPTPEEKAQIRSLTGVDWDRLALAGSYAEDLLVLRYGWVVGDWGQTWSSEDMASSIKSLTGAAMARLFTLSAEGRLAVQIGPEDYVYRFLPPAWGEVDPRRKLIKIKHLMTHTSGLEPLDPLPDGDCSWVLGQQVLGAPGSRFQYSSANAQLESMIIQEVTGLSLQDFINRELVPLIGASPWEADEWDCGYARGSGGKWDARSFARVAYLLMHGGVWDDGNGPTPVIREPYRSQLTQWSSFLQTVESAPDGRGYWHFNNGQDITTFNWWSNRTGQAVSSALPGDAFCASGWGKTLVCGVPSLDLVIVRTGSEGDLNGVPEFFEVLGRLIADSIVDGPRNE